MLAMGAERRSRIYGNLFCNRTKIMGSRGRAARNREAVVKS